jgi:fructosamine-3-kinase
VTPEARRRIEAALGARIRRLTPLTGGSIADVRRADLDDGRRVTVKIMTPRPQPGDLPAATLEDEAAMLAILRECGAVPAPDVHLAEPALLVMDYIESGGAPAEEALADAIAALHDVAGPAFGFARPTPIGPLQRPNSWNQDWASFLAGNRLLFLGRLADAAGRLPPGALQRLELLCAVLSRWIPSDRTPSLIHGDLWIGNILSLDGRLTALIDPAVYYADAEIELAFLTLFGGVGERFFARYAEHRPIDPLFFEERRALYQLEPLLAHAWFFGGGYGARADAILQHFVGGGGTA